MDGEDSELKTIRGLLKQEGYSEKAIEEILKWYGFQKEEEPRISSFAEFPYMTF